MPIAAPTIDAPGRVFEKVTVMGDDVAELGDLVGEIRAAAARPLDQAIGLPARAYGSAGLYELEVERIFRRDWMCVGRLD